MRWGLWGLNVENTLKPEARWVGLPSIHKIVLEERLHHSLSSIKIAVGLKDENGGKWRRESESNT